MKRTILFVDDEPNILQGLKRMLRPMREKWDMLFAGSGAEALEIMAGQPVDAVVSDMRMPGMDGAELLRRVLESYPEAVRIALSGYSDQEMVSRSIAPSHQYLMKPCEAEKVVQAVENALEARRLISNRSVLDRIMRIEHLPILPDVYQRISTELTEGDPSPKRIGELVAADVGMSANILKLVNSAYFGLSRKVASPQQAVIILGVGVLRSVILSQHLFSFFEGRVEPPFSLTRLWEHCMRTSAIARSIARAEGACKEVADDACTAALLHDVGKLLLHATCPEECVSVLAEVRKNNRRVCDVEREKMGMTHAEVGAYLLALWGLPDAVVRAIGEHHMEDSAPQLGLDAAAIVYFANVLDHRVFVFNDHFARAEASAERLAGIGGPEKFAGWETLTKGLKLEEEGNEQEGPAC